MTDETQEIAAVDKEVDRLANTVVSAIEGVILAVDKHRDTPTHAAAFATESERDAMRRFVIMLVEDPTLVMLRFAAGAGLLEGVPATQVATDQDYLIFMMTVALLGALRANPKEAFIHMLRRHQVQDLTKAARGVTP